MLIFHELEVYTALEFIKDNEYLAFDVETTGLEPRRDKTVGFGFSNYDEGFYIVHLEWDGEKLVERVSKDTCLKILNLLNTKNWVGWNSSFEVRCCRHYFSIDLSSSLWSEGMLSRHTSINEHKSSKYYGSYKLKDVAKSEYGEIAVSEQADLFESIKANGGSPDEYYKADAGILGKYCIKDCLLTFRLNKKYLDDLYLRNLDKFYFQDEVMPLYRDVTIEMEDRGIRLDIPLLKNTEEEISKDIEYLENCIRNQIDDLLDDFRLWFLNKELPVKRTGDFVQYLIKYLQIDLPTTPSGRFSLSRKNIESLGDCLLSRFLLNGERLSEDVISEVRSLWWEEASQGRPMFNLSSKHHLKKLFFEKLQEVPVSTTEKGNPQVDKIFLENMEKKYEWAKLLQDFNKLNKIKSTYVDRFLNSHLDGIFYPSWFQHRTITGRYGSDIQQLPRPKSVKELSPLVLKYNNIIRKFFIARKGYVFIDADYESLDPHVFAHVSGDPKLLEVFNQGLDFHSMNAISGYNLTDVSADKSDSEKYVGAVYPELRQAAKEFGLGLAYGMSPYALSKTLDTSEYQAKTIYNNYFKEYSVLKTWMEQCFEELISTGQTRSEAGRVVKMSAAPAIWKGHYKYIKDPLKIWEIYHNDPPKYKQMKFLYRKFKDFCNSNMNFRIQSMSATITSRACIAINRELKRKKIDGGVVAQIHDQIITEIPVELAEQFQSVKRFLMENAYPLKVPLKAPSKIGVDFEEAH